MRVSMCMPHEASLAHAETAEPKPKTFKKKNTRRPEEEPIGTGGTRELSSPFLFANPELFVSSSWNYKWNWVTGAEQL